MSGMVTTERISEYRWVVRSVVAWARRHDDIVAVAVVGSWARHEAHTESDLDLVVLTTEKGRYTSDASWVTDVVGPAVDARLVRTRHWGPLTERRVELPSGFEIEFGFANPRWASADLVDTGTAQVVGDGCLPVYDPTGAFTRLVAAVTAPRGETVMRSTPNAVAGFVVDAVVDAGVSRLPEQTSVVLRIRLATIDDTAFVRKMLAVAADWRPDAGARSVREIMSEPKLAHYVAGWPADTDVGFIAEIDRAASGAAWWRFFSRSDPGFGFVDEAVPEVTIGVLEAARGQGVGTRLLGKLVDEARRRSIPALSLSVEPDNPATSLYERLGFMTVGGVGNSHTMVLKLTD